MREEPHARTVQPDDEGGGPVEELLGVRATPGVHQAMPFPAEEDFEPDELFLNEFQEFHVGERGCGRHSTRTLWGVQL